MTTTRHTMIKALIERHGKGELTDLELFHRMAYVISSHSCDCLQCSE